jgi:hypothetical protein
MNKLKNTLDILNSESVLFHDWKCEDVEGNNIVSAKFFYDGNEIAVIEWLDCMHDTFSPDTYYSNGGGAENLALEMDTPEATAYLAYKAFISEFNIAYNLAKGE